MSLEILSKDLLTIEQAARVFTQVNIHSEHKHGAFLPAVELALNNPYLSRFLQAKRGETNALRVIQTTRIVRVRFRLF